MKLFKTSFFSLLLIALAGMLAMAFTEKKQTTTKKKTDTFYYYYLKADGNAHTASDYTERVEEEPMPCGGDADVCWIKAEDNGYGIPDITTELHEEIDDALGGNADTDNVKLKN